MTVAYDVVVPTVGRPCLATLIDALDRDRGPAPRRVIVVDDRRCDESDAGRPALGLRAATLDIQVVVTCGQGPAAARNAGWRRCGSPWIVFLDDDVVIQPGWRRALVEDLERADADAAAVQAQVTVPLPGDRPPTDWERNVAGLSDAAWITADMAIRRRALSDVEGFDERFRRAYREDTDLALRFLDAGWRLVIGTRRTEHPVRPAPWYISVRTQRGNGDDMLMRRLHGRAWRARGAAPRGLLRFHAATTAAGLVALGAFPSRRRAFMVPACLIWLAMVGHLWWRRVAPGPRRATEWVRMAATSALIPFVATAWAALGYWHARGERSRPAGVGPSAACDPPALVLFDRDGTLVHDVPYNGDPALVCPVPGARAALDRLRARGVPVGVVTNQSGVARGALDLDQVRAVNRRVEELLGPFVTVRSCPHGPDDGCACRKPAPGMVIDACREAGVEPQRSAVVGDTAADVDAALAAGARALLVPNERTLPGELLTAPEVASSISHAVDAILRTDDARGGGVLGSASWPESPRRLGEEAS